MTEPFNVNDLQPEAQRPDLSVRTPPRRVSGLRRRTIRLAIALLAAVVAAALIIGLGIDFRSHAPSESRRIDTPPENMQLSPIADLPSSYADVPRTHPPAATQMPAENHDMHRHGEAAPTTSATEERKDELARLLASIQQVGRKNQQLAQQLAAYQSASAQEQAKVWGSGLFFKIDQTPDRQAIDCPKDASRATSAADTVTLTKNLGAPNAAGATPPPPSASPSPADQHHKLSFLNESPAPQLAIDRSPVAQVSAAVEPGGYLLQTGTVIPAALLTGINTDLPGDVVASVTEGVYDSPPAITC